MCLKHYTRVLYDLWCISHHHHHRMCTVHWVDLLPPTFNATLHSLHPYDALFLSFSSSINGLPSPLLALLCSMDALKCSRSFIQCGEGVLWGACARQDDRIECESGMFVRWYVAMSGGRHKGETTAEKQHQKGSSSRIHRPCVVVVGVVFVSGCAARRGTSSTSTAYAISFSLVILFIFHFYII